MSKLRKSILDFKDAALTRERQYALKGGKNYAKEIEKHEKKLAKALQKGDQKKIDKYMEKLDCLKFEAGDCCGNGLGVW